MEKEKSVNINYDYPVRIFGLTQEAYNKNGIKTEVLKEIERLRKLSDNSQEFNKYYI